MQSKISKRTTKRTSAHKVKVDWITPDPEILKRLPKTVAGIERWILAMGGKKVGRRERIELTKRGLLGMPDE